jgi:SnoaL-like domain
MTKKVSTIAAELADREAIRDCFLRYCRGVDRVDVDLMLSAFWPDATDQHGNFEARSAQGWVNQALEGLKTLDLTSHVMGNILIDIQGDTACVESYICTIHVARKPTGERYDHLSASRFVDRMEKRDDEWRIKTRVVVRDWYREFPDSYSWDQGAFPKTYGYGKNRPLDLGQRKPDDRSYQLLKHS